MGKRTSTKINFCPLSGFCLVDFRICRLKGRSRLLDQRCLKQLIQNSLAGEVSRSGKNGTIDHYSTTVIAASGTFGHGEYPVTAIPEQ